MHTRIIWVDGGARLLWGAEIDDSRRNPQQTRNEGGGFVAFIETGDGVLISPQAVIATQALDRIGDALQEGGVDIDELIGEGRAVRTELLEEEYGIKADE